MYLIIRESNGRTREAVALAAGAGRIRLIIRGVGETREYHWSAGNWAAEDGTRVELESMVVDGSADQDAICSLLRPRTMAAGSAHVLWD